MIQARARRLVAANNLTVLTNPWEHVTLLNGSYILPPDREHICAHNKRLESKRPDSVIIEGSIPEPFIGSPRTARVVLLNLNRGHSDTDASDYTKASVRNAMFNVRQVSQPYRFYSLNPAFADTGAGRWWRPRLRQLQVAAKLSTDDFAKRLMVIEWFSYHSQRFVRPRSTIPSQEYSFCLAKNMLEALAKSTRYRIRAAVTSVRVTPKVHTNRS